MRVAESPAEWCSCLGTPLDVVERLDATFDGNSSMLQRAEVSGEVLCNCCLSGARPEVRVSLWTTRLSIGLWSRL